jgi:hypothetical protein
MVSKMNSRLAIWAGPKSLVPLGRVGFSIKQGKTSEIGAHICKLHPPRLSSRLIHKTLLICQLPG